MTPSKRNYSSKNSIEIGNSYYNDHNYSEAIKCYENSIFANRRVKLAWLLKGVALREMGKAREAISCFCEAIKLDNRYIDALIEKAFTYYISGDHIQSTKYFREVLKMQPKSLGALTGLGLIAFDQGKYHDAITFYNKAIGNRQDPHLASIFENKGTTYSAMGKFRYNDALDNYNKAIAINKNRVGAIVGIGIILDEYGKKEESDKKFAEAFNVDPNYVYLWWISKGVSLEKDVKREEAIEYFKKSLNPNSRFRSLALINIGLIYLLQGEYQESMNYFNEALNEDSNYSALALVCQCSALYKLNNPDAAYECYINAFKLDKDLEIDLKNLITYNSLDGDYAFFEGYDTNLVIDLLRDIREKADKHGNKVTNGGNFGEMPLHIDITKNNLSSKINRLNPSDEVLSEAKMNANNAGLTGELIINNYLDYLTKIKKIRGFKWISENEKYSPYDFCIIDNNGVHNFIDVKSTEGEFNSRFYISYGELKQMAFGEERYDIYRVYQIYRSSAKLRISRNLRLFAKKILDVFERLPEGVIPDSISVSTSLLVFDPEIELLQRYENQL